MKRRRAPPPSQVLGPRALLIRLSSSGGCFGEGFLANFPQEGHKRNGEKEKKEWGKWGLRKRKNDMKEEKWEVWRWIYEKW